MNFAVQTSPPTKNFEELIGQIESLLCAIVQRAESGKNSVQALAPERRQSAENLLHYLAMRNTDLRPLQDQLACLGLSSLGRAEAHVHASITAVLNQLYLMRGPSTPPVIMPDWCCAFAAAADRLELNTAMLLGEPPKKRRVHIMVTMAAAAADDYLLIHQLLQSGMNCMRINCARDDPSIWSLMITNLRHAERATGQSCRILMDLGGPKLRLGRMELVPAVLKIKPHRAENGRVLQAARIWLAAANAEFSEMPAADASLALDADWLAKVKAGDRVRFRDARGSGRSWRVKEVTQEGCWVEARKTAYLVNGTALMLHSKKTDKPEQTEVCGLALQESVCLIRSGDVLHISANEQPGKAAVHDSHGKLMNPGRVSLLIPEVYRDVRPGEPIFFDDGRIAGIVEKNSSGEMQIRITHTRKPVEKLEGNRGINLPETRLNLAALGPKDLQDLEFVAQHADMVGLSFTNGPDDVRALYQSLQDLGREDIGVVLKIETKRGFSSLPAILLEALRFPACGVMIARGDLAVECGFERLSELQEEILWLCEAAHVPVIWATQVLEGLTRRGHVSRAEITDAAMAQAAEAVMLNKGAHIIEAVEMLDNILQRMQGHHRKKRSMLRKLQLATEFQPESSSP